ncbi:unnamed protein product [Rhizophagus irregularis]|uniref:Uncharacterized protein n=1 Tax=Rhizophagus irregularis TaxID=588596 RepID=A0A915ZHK6_9GLOM|nr:unnamed protein product [Rhizophagus irregularis]
MTSFNMKTKYVLYFFYVYNIVSINNISNNYLIILDNKLETLIEESNTDINEYITKEYELDIDDTQRDSIIQNSNIQYCSNSLNSETNPLRKRNIEELNVEIQDNGKHIKISDEIDKEIKE